jgi:hypothetical protein
MKNLSLIIILFAVSLNWSFGQTTPEPIRIDKVTGGYSYYHKGDNLGERGLSNILKQNDKAYRRYKAGEKQSLFFHITSICWWSYDWLATRNLCRRRRSQLDARRYWCRNCPCFYTHI